MQHVTLETAKALRDAGFPQPEPIPGQVWYSKHGQSWVIGICNPTGIVSLFSPEEDTLWGLSASSIQTTLIFAPTAPDILRELGEDYNLTICGPFFRWEQMKADDYFVLGYWQDENPAEGGAKAWLAKEQK